MWLAWLLACAPEPAPATPGSRSATLAAEAGTVAFEAREIAAQARDIEGWMDDWKAADPAARPAIEARIRERAYELQDRALAIQERVMRLEAAARVEGAPEPQPPVPEAPGAVRDGAP